MDANIHRIPNLIFKQFDQTITTSEVKELNDWIQSSQQNKELYDEIIDSRNLTSSLKRHFSYDIESAKNKIKNAVEPNKYNKRKFKSILKYAAIIIPLLTGSFFIISELANPETKKVLALEDFDFQPGSKKAVLKLNNGEEVTLGENSTANKIKIDRMTMAIDRDFSLAYNEGSQAIENVANNTLMVPVGGEYKLVLADGTNVWLNSNTQITYPVQFTDSIRKVQVQGEAYFEVVHNPQKPFVVETPSYAIEVLGTSFNVMSYQNEDQSATTLVKGKVKIGDIVDEESIVLKPGEQAALNYKSGKYSVREVEVAHYTAWKDGLFSFQSAPLSEIMRRLSRWYDCDFQFEDSSLENLHFTGTLDKHQNLKELLLLISETCSVDFNVNKENIILISSK